MVTLQLKPLDDGSCWQMLAAGSQRSLPAQQHPTMAPEPADPLSCAGAMPEPPRPLVSSFLAMPCICSSLLGMLLLLKSLSAAHARPWMPHRQMIHLSTQKPISKKRQAALFVTASRLVSNSVENEAFLPVVLGIPLP